MHKSPSPNVGIALLAATLMSAPLYAEYAWGGYTELSKADMQQLSQGSYSVAQLLGQTRAFTTEQALIPFFHSRSRLGPRGRDAIHAAILLAAKGNHVKVVATISKKERPALRDSRLKTIVDALIAAGIPASHITTTSGDPLPDRQRGVYNSYIEIHIPADPTTPAAASPPQQNTSALLAPTQAAGATPIIPGAYPIPGSTPKPKMPADWVLISGTSLRANLDAWMASAHWNSLDWRLSDPYNVSATIHLHGSLLDALRQVAKAAPKLNFVVDMRQKKITVTQQEPES